MKISEFNKLSREERLKVPFKDKPWPTKYIPLAFLLILIISFSTCFRNESGSAAKAPESTDIANRAKVVTETSVKALLKAPATAKFTDEDQQVLLFSDSTVTVRGYVDAQNTFGAMIRSGYYVKLKWIGDINENTNWLTLDAALNE